MSIGELGNEVEIDQGNLSSYERGILDDPKKAFAPGHFWKIVKYFAGRPGGLEMPGEAVYLGTLIGESLSQRQLELLFGKEAVAKGVIVPHRWQVTRIRGDYLPRPGLEEQIKKALLSGLWPVAIVGMPGSGKTTIARVVAWDERVETRFWRGDLWADVRGVPARLTLEKWAWEAYGLEMGRKRDEQSLRNALRARLSTWGQLPRQRDGVGRRKLAERDTLLILDDVVDESMRTRLWARLLMDDATVLLEGVDEPYRQGESAD